MRILPTLLLAVLTVSLVACGRSDQINGRSNSTAYRSVKIIKERLPAEKRIEFEISFWTIRDANKDPDEFLSQVDGKNPDEIIALGREIYQQRKNQGFKEYQNFGSWEDMIDQYGKERREQDRTVKPDPRDKANDVLYKL
ncbi:MAG: hypothetical protein Kow0065_16590 [Methylomicrobium sp.]